VQRKTNFLAENNNNRAGQPIVQQQQQAIDPALLQQISENVKNFKFEMVNTLNRVRT
jgi:hypothetical protein